VLYPNYPLNEAVKEIESGGGDTPQIIEHEVDGKLYKFNATYDGNKLNLEPIEAYPELEDEGFAIKVSKNIKKELNKVQQTNQERNSLKAQNAEYQKQQEDFKAQLAEQRRLLDNLALKGDTKIKTQPETPEFDDEKELFKLAKVDNWDDYSDLTEAEKERMRFKVSQKREAFKSEQTKKDMMSMFNENFSVQQQELALSQVLAKGGYTLQEAKAWIANQAMPVNASSIDYFLLKHKKTDAPDPIKTANKIASLFNTIPGEMTAKGEIDVSIRKAKSQIEQDRQEILDA